MKKDSTIKLEIAGIGTFSLLSKDLYLKHRTRQNMGEAKLKLSEFAHLILEQNKWFVPTKTISTLEEAGWEDVVEELEIAEKSPEVEEERKKHLRDQEIIRTEKLLMHVEHARDFGDFFKDWSEGTSRQISSDKDREYWAARDFVSSPVGENEIDDEDDGSVRRFHQAALLCLANWRAHSDVDYESLATKLAEIKPAPDVDDSEELDLGDLLRRDGEVIAYQEWDSGAVGAGAGIVEVYEMKGKFFSIHDAGIDEYPKAQAAINGSGVLIENDATVEIWIDEDFEDDTGC